MPNLSTHAVRLPDGEFASYQDRVIVGRPAELIAAGLTSVTSGTGHVVCILLDAPQVSEREQMTVATWLDTARGMGS